MQAELIKDKHRKLLASNFGKTFEDLKSMSEEDLDDFVLQELGMAECDEVDENGNPTERGQTISEIIDIICGPYDPEEINDKEDEAEIPNAITLAAMQEAEEMEKRPGSHKTYNSFSEMVQDLEEETEC